MRAGRIRLLAAALLISLFAVLAVRGWTQAQRSLELVAICAASQEQQWQEAVDLGTRSIGSAEDSLIAIECRCVALHALARRDECRELLEETLSAESHGTWLPSADLSLDLAAARREQGRLTEATRLAHEAALAYPDHLPVRLLELELRCAGGEAGGVLEELWARPPSEPHALAAFRLFVADRYRAIGRPSDALAVLGGQAPEGTTRDEQFAWFEQRARALGRLGRTGELAEAVAIATGNGHSAVAVRALYALVLEEEGLGSPEADPTALLLESVSKLEEIADPWLRETVLRRVIMGLVVAGQPDEALRLYDQGRREFSLVGLRRDEIEREALRPVGVSPRPAAATGRLIFQVPDGLDGAAVRLSPAAGQDIDAPWVELAIPAGGRLRVNRRTDYVPSRWLLVDGNQQVLGSGAAWPRAGTDTLIEVTAGSSRSPATFQAAQGPADGRRRVFVVLTDCGDWRIVQYLRQRGELPVLDYLARHGRSSVLISAPPFTAAAMRSLVHPESQERVGLFSVLYALGEELKGLSSVEENPAAALGWLLPEEEDLFATVGSGELQAANLLFAHGGLSGGANALVTGPRGAQRSLDRLRVQRPLRSDEREAHPALATIPAEHRELIERIAAELDTATSLARSGELDLLLLRVEALDLLTHGFYAEIARSHQDNGDGVLYSAYRYLDERIGQLHSSMDEDDILIVLSDHGIRTAMQHDRHALLLMAGGGIQVGRSSGTPDFRGIPRLLADLLGIEVQWPDTGIGSGE